MEVTIVLLYIAVGLCVLSCVGMGILAIIDWAHYRDWDREREILEANLIKKDRLTYQYYKDHPSKVDDYRSINQQGYCKKQKPTSPRPAPPKPQTKARF